jgi:kumamolisin
MTRATSAASPLWASLVALINAMRPVGQCLGYVTLTLYQGAGSEGCTDVHIGDNATEPLGGYSAAVGYDAVSG